MSVIWFVVVFAITHLIIAAFAYRWGEERGFEEGYEVGKDDGFKAGMEQGMQAGMKASVKEQMLSSLVKTPPIPGIQVDLQEQVKQELLTAMNDKAKTSGNKLPPTTAESWWDAVWENFAGWLVLIVFVLLLALLFS